MYRLLPVMFWPDPLTYYVLGWPGHKPTLLHFRCSTESFQEKARSSRSKLLNGHTQKCPFCHSNAASLRPLIFVSNICNTRSLNDCISVCFVTLKYRVLKLFKCTICINMFDLPFPSQYWCLSATPTVHNVRNNPSNIHWVHWELRLGS